MCFHEDITSNSHNAYAFFISPIDSQNILHRMHMHSKTCTKCICISFRYRSAMQNTDSCLTIFSKKVECTCFIVLKPKNAHAHEECICIPVISLSILKMHMHYHQNWKHIEAFFNFQ